MMMEERNKERAQVSYFAILLEHFWGYHKDFIKEEEVSKWLEDAQTGRLTFKAVIEPKRQDHPLTVLSVICEAISEEVKANIERFKNFTTRSYSQKPMSEMIYWEHLRKAKPAQVTNLPEVYREAEAVYLNWIKQLKDGSLRIDDLNEIWKMYFDKNDKALFDEMDDMLSENKELLGERKEQVEIGLHLENYYQGAETFITLKEDFTPQGDYQEFMELFVEKHKEDVGRIELRSISNQLVRCSKLIKDLTDDQWKCLKTCFESKDLIMCISANISEYDDKMATENDSMADALVRARQVVSALRSISQIIQDVKEDGCYFTFFSSCETRLRKTNLESLVTDIVYTKESGFLRLLSEFKTKKGIGCLHKLIQARISNAEVDDQKSGALQRREYVLSKEKEYSRAFYKYLQNKGNQEIEDLKTAFRSLFITLLSQKSELDCEKPDNAKSHTESETANTELDKVVHFFVALPEVLKNQDDIEVGIVKYSADCEKLLILKRISDRLFCGQCQFFPEKCPYAYVISFDGWSVVEWFGKRQQPRIWNHKDGHSQYVFDGAILCNPDCNENDVRLRGLLSMLPKISDEPNLFANADIEEWVMTVCDQQLKFLEDGGVITSKNPLYENHKKYLEGRWKSGVPYNGQITSKLLRNTRFLCISTINGEGLLKELTPFIKEGWILLSLVLRLFSKEHVFDLFKEENLNLPAEELIAITAYVCKDKREGDSTNLSALCENLLRHIKLQISFFDRTKLLAALQSARYLIDHVPKESIKSATTLLLLLMEERAVKEYGIEPVTRERLELQHTTYLRIMPDQLSVLANGAKPEIIQQNDGITLKFPFSWLVKERLDIIMSTFGEERPYNAERAEEMELRYGKTDLGKHMKFHLDEFKKKDSLKAYINDFLLFCHPHLNQKELKICQKILWITVKNNSMTLSAVHLFHKKMQGKFETILNLLKHNPNGCDNLNCTDLSVSDTEMLANMLEKLEQIPPNAWLADAYEYMQTLRKFQPFIHRFCNHGKSGAFYKKDGKVNICKLMLPRCYSDKDREVGSDWPAIEHDANNPDTTSPSKQNIAMNDLPSLDVSKHLTFPENLERSVHMMQEELADAELVITARKLTHLNMAKIKDYITDLQIILDLFADDTDIDRSFSLRGFSLQSVGVDFEFLSNSVQLRNVLSVWVLLKCQEAVFQSGEVLFDEHQEEFLKKFKSIKTQLIESFRKNSTAEPERPQSTSTKYDWETVKFHLKRLCKEVGAENAYAWEDDKELAKCTVIGQNLSLLEMKIKEDAYLNQFNIVVFEKAVSALF